MAQNTETKTRARRGSHNRLTAPLNQSGLPSPQHVPGHLSTATLDRLLTAFKARGHRPSTAMWDAIDDILQTLEQMAEGTAEPKVHLASLDPGVGKTQSIVQFLPVLLSHKRCDDVSVIICAGRISQIEQMVNDAKAAGLKDEDFAVYTSDDTQNARGRGIDGRHLARVLFTTHSMVMKRCAGGSFAAAEGFHYRHEPRDVRVWDEAIVPGLALTLSAHDLASLIKPVSFHSVDLTSSLSHLFADLLTKKDGEQFTVPNLVVGCGLDLNDLEGIFDDHPADLKTAANALWFLCDKTVTVRQDKLHGNAILDYRETFPPDLVPLLVLDASSRRGVRETYSLWDAERGNIKRLAEAPKDYSPLILHHWATSGGKTAFKDRDSRKRLIQGIANTVNQKPAERWLIIHHKDDTFAEDVRLLIEPTADVSFLHWGRHDATNDYADIPNVILAGTLFLRPSQYEALGRAAAGRPSAAGPFPVSAFEAVRQGEHRHMILQAACRGLVRKCHGASCPPANVYIVASRGSHIAEGLPVVFPAAHVVRWRPVERKLTGNVGKAAAFVIERAKDGAFVPSGDVMKHIGVTNKANFNRQIKKHDDFQDAIAEHDIVAAQRGRHTGFQRSFFTYFPDTSETMNITDHTTHASTLTVDGETKTVHVQILDRDRLLEEAQARAEQARRRLTVADTKVSAR